MASFFGHITAGIGIQGLFPTLLGKQGWLLSLGLLYTVIPDADVIAWHYGISSNHILGHRGFSHSISFALIAALLGARLFSSPRWSTTLFLFCCMLSHDILDGMTTGGPGIAYFWPLSDERHFLPWRPIQVSPLGIKSFFSEWGWRVIKSEAIYIGIPTAVILLSQGYRKWIRHVIERSTGQGR